MHRRTLKEFGLPDPLAVHGIQQRDRFDPIEEGTKKLSGMKTAAFHRITNAITSDDEQKLFLIDAPYDACSCIVALLQRNYKNNMAITHSH